MEDLKLGAVEEKFAELIWAHEPLTSRELAELLQANLVTCVDPANTRTAAAVDPALYLYRSVTCPAVLVEVGYLSNEAELKKIVSAEYQNKIVSGILAGLAGYGSFLR